MRAVNCDYFLGEVAVESDLLLVLMVEDHRKNRRWFSCFAPVENPEHIFRGKTFSEICFSARTIGMKEFSVTPRFKRKMLKVVSCKK